VGRWASKGAPERAVKRLLLVGIGRYPHRRIARRSSSTADQLSVHGKRDDLGLGRDWSYAVPRHEPGRGVAIGIILDKVARSAPSLLEDECWATAPLTGAPRTTGRANNCTRLSRYESRDTQPSGRSGEGRHSVGE
jgi:hypothetical protein